MDWLGWILAGGMFASFLIANRARLLAERRCWEIEFELLRHRPAIDALRREAQESF